MSTVEDSLVDVHPSVKPTPVIQESTKILPVVKAENFVEHYNQKPPEHYTQATASLAAAARPPEQSVAPSQDVERKHCKSSTSSCFHARG